MSQHSAAYEEKLSDLLDGRLPADEARAMRRHLEACEQCRTEYEAMAAARELLHGTSEPAVPGGLLASIREQVEAEMPQPTAAGVWDRWRVPLAAVAAAAAVLLAVFTPGQLMNRDASRETLPPTDPPVVAVQPAPEQPTVTAEEAGADEVEVADLPAEESEVPAGSETVVAARPAAPAAPSRTVRRASGPSPPPAAEAEPPAEEVEEPQAPVEVEVGPPALAAAPVDDTSETVVAEPVLGEEERPTVIALGPRMTFASEHSPEPAGPSELETEMATGVVAGMLLDQYVTEHMLESSSTLLSVVTDTPTSELGPVLATEEDENGGFGLCFTEAMRRALTESENQLP
ncbi:MAG: anti-sigma factor family protein [Armatimonadota bacterium]